MEYLINTDRIANGDILEVDANHKWGRELCLVNGIYCGKLLELSQPGVKGSLHYHRDKTESFIILSGIVHIYAPDSDIRDALYYPGNVLTLIPGQRHQFWAVKRPALLLEVSTPHSDSDTYRFGNG
jgi:mannose-6-phosphate isomerase-like protein (cupin superfamily)